MKGFNRLDFTSGELYCWKYNLFGLKKKDRWGEAKLINCFVLPARVILKTPHEGIFSWNPRVKRIYLPFF